MAQNASIMSQLMMPVGTYSIADGKLILVNKFNGTNTVDFVVTNDTLTIHSDVHFRDKDSPNKASEPSVAPAPQVQR